MVFNIGCPFKITYYSAEVTVGEGGGGLFLGACKNCVRGKRESWWILSASDPF